MRAVNLASKPFVNRRPVIRIAFLVWIAAIVLAVVNIWSYGDFFRIASNHRARLADLEKEIRIEEEQVTSLEKRIAGLRLDDGNTKARYLNGLIHQRIFPWSRLFDEIQDVLPKDVYLIGLAPQIEKLESPKRPRSTTSSRTRNTSTSTSSSTSRTTRTTKKKPEPELDRVLLELQGVARSDEAMLELVDRLYASPSFLDPTLSTEKRETRTGLVAFQIEVTYLTGTGSVKTEGDAPTGDRASSDRASSDRASSDRASRDTATGSGSGDAAGAALPDAVAEGGNLYGQPGFTPPAGGAGSGGTGAGPPSRPGFEPDSRGGGTSAGGTGAGRAGSPTRPAQPGQPGFGATGPGNTNPQRPQDGTGGTVVIPRRSPGALGAAPSSSPRLGAGGG